MEEVIPWEKLEEFIVPLAPKEVPGEPGGRPAYSVSVMLRIYFCQSWYQLSDEAVEDSLYDSESLRRFCLGTRARRELPDETSVRRFRPKSNHPFHARKSLPIQARATAFTGVV